MATKKTSRADLQPRADSNAGKAPTSTRSLWKGAISFGLVHVPIALYSATDESDLSFKMLDKRSMDPVGYKRINKKNGKEVAMADIVKGIEWDDGRFVLLSPEEIEAAYPKTTQTIEIEAFVPIDEIPFVYLEKPYYTAPVNRGQKVYALLREALAATRKVGVAKVVIANKPTKASATARVMTTGMAACLAPSPHSASVWINRPSCFTRLKQWSDLAKDERGRTRRNLESRRNPGRGAPRSACPRCAVPQRGGCRSPARTPAQAPALGPVVLRRVGGGFRDLPVADRHRSAVPRARAT